MPSAVARRPWFIRHLRLVGVAVAALSALALLGVFTIQRTLAASEELGPWLETLEEIPKGLLAAAAVTVLYDWLLRLENDASITEAVREGLEEIKFDLAGGGREIYADYLKELTILPLDKGLAGEGGGRFYRVSVHCRFYARYFGDKLGFVLMNREGFEEASPLDPSVVFYWVVNRWPSPAVKDEWLEVESVSVDGCPWVRSHKEAAPRLITAQFERPKGARPAGSHVMSYQFDLRVLDYEETLSFFIDRPTNGLTLRVDARQVGVKSIICDAKQSLKGALKSRYSARPEGEGTCEVFVPGRVDEGTTIRFTLDKP